MKLFGIFAASALAQDAAWDQVEKRGGKHGRVNMGDGNQDRLLLHHPMCMTFPDHPNCEESCQQTFTSFSGKIEIKDYESYTSCLWQIKLPPTRTIEIQFTGDFDLEYHYQCGYDRVHIFSGSIDGDNQRQGRFCGPKGSDEFPWDGSKRNVATNGEMNFFSHPFDIQNNNAIIGFDADQNLVGGGFTLEWNSHKIYEYDFTDVFEAHEFVTKKADYLFNSVFFGTVKEKKLYQKQLDGRITAASLRALQNNPGSPAGFKKRRCAKSQQESVSNETVQIMMNLSDNETADFRDAMAAMEALITEFLGNCKIGGKRWPLRVSEFGAKVEADRRY